MVEVSYNDAILRLNAMNLAESIKLCSILSCLEYKGGIYSPLFPLINNEKIRLFGEAIIRSNSAWYKSKQLSFNDLVFVLNGTHSALDDQRIKDIPTGAPRHEMLYELQKFFSRMAYLQIRPQQSPIIPLGQLLCIIEYLCVTQWSKLPESIQGKAREFPSNVKRLLGSTAYDLIKCNLHIATKFSNLGKNILEKLPEVHGGDLPVMRQRAMLEDLFIRAHQTLDYFCIDESDVRLLKSMVSDEVLKSYFGIFSKPILDHRILMREPVYNIGKEGLRLTSLDRYPIIADKKFSNWYVPNLRLLMHAPHDVLHYALCENCREEYQEIRGFLFEIYIAELLKARMPTLKVIPELKWDTAKGEVAGPDLIVIDHQNPIVIGIEIKSRKMMPKTRYELNEQDIDDNYGDLWQAIKTLPGKMRDIYSIPLPYEIYKDDLIKSQGYPRCMLGLAGDAPYMFGELACYKATYISEFPLHGLNETWTIMTIPVFERFIETIVQTKRPLAAVLREYLEDCKSLEMNTPMAESFRNVTIIENDSFAAQSLTKIGTTPIFDY